MKNISANSRYIYCQFTRGTRGLRHQVGLLQMCLIRYAAGMQRVAVLSNQLPLDKKHNQGCDIDCNPYLYYDFDHMTYYSNAYKATTPLPCIRVSDLDMSQFSEKDIKVFKAQDGPAHISKEDDKNYRLIIIEHRTWNWPHKCDHIFLPKTKLPYSAKVRSTAMQVINQMMESQSSWNHQFSGSIEDSHLRLDYCCVHARRTDRLNANWSITMPMNIKRNLDANQDIDNNTPIYLMTDEPDDHFYDKLKEYYPNLIRYSDFPELYHLRHPADGSDPNNYLLFAIEMQMQTMAKIRYKATSYNKYAHLHKGYKIPCQWWFWSREKAEKLCLSRRQNLDNGLIEFYPYRILWYKFTSILITLMKILADLITTLCSLIKTPVTLIKRIRKSFFFRLTKLKNKVKN